MDPLEFGAQPRCPHCGVLMRPDGDGDVCPECGRLEPYVDVTRPVDDGPGLPGF